MGHTAQHCRRGLFQDPDFAGDLEDSKSTSGGVLCISGSRTKVPVTWMCKKQTADSHSSTESENHFSGCQIAYGCEPALDLWDTVIEVLRSTNNNAQPEHNSIQESGATLDSKTNTQNIKRRQKAEQLNDVDCARKHTFFSR